MKTRFAFLLFIVCFAGCAKDSSNKQKQKVNVSAETDENQSNIDSLLAFSAANRRSAPDTVLQLLKHALDTESDDALETTRWKLLKDMGECHAYAGDTKRATVCIDSAKRIAVNQGNWYAVADCYNSMALVQHMHGNMDSVNHFLSKAEILLDSKGVKEGLPIILCRKGFVFNVKGIYSESLKYSLRSIKISKELDPSALGFPQAYNNIGVLYERQGEYARALPYYQVAKRIYEQKADSQSLADVLENMGIIQRNLGNIDSAFYYLHAGLKIKLKMSNTDLIGRAYYNLGNSYRVIERLDSAKHYFKKALALRAGEKVTSNDGYVHYGYGRVLMDQGQPDLAEIELENALKIAEDVDSKRLKEDVTQSLYELDRKKGSYKSAMEYLEMNVDLERERLNFEQTREMERLAAESKFQQKSIADSLNFSKQRTLDQYELQNRDQEIAYGNATIRWLIGLLVLILIGLAYVVKTSIDRRKTNKKLEEQKGVIEESLKKKELLIKEVHHRVKNNLQVVSSLLSLQSANFSDQQMQSVFDESQRRIETIALLHTKLYQVDDLGYVSLKAYLNDLVSQIQMQFDPTKTAQVEVSGEEVTVDIDQAVPLGLMANEIVSNAFKHVKLDQGLQIVVSMRQTNEVLHLEFKDNGIGLPKEQRNFDSDKSLGLKLIKMLCIQIKAQLEYKFEKGAVFLINMSLKTNNPDA